MLYRHQKVTGEQLNIPLAKEGFLANPVAVALALGGTRLRWGRSEFAEVQARESKLLELSLEVPFLTGS